MTSSKNVESLYHILRSGNEYPEVMNAILAVIRDDAEARRTYLRLVHMDVNIPWAIDSISPVELTIQHRFKTRQMRQRWLRWGGIGSIALTMTLLLFVGIHHYYRRMAAELDKPLIAAAMEIDGDVVIAGKVSPSPPTFLRFNSSLVLQSGSILMRSGAGTLMAMTGPAVLEFQGPQTVKLDRGTLLTTVAAGDEGFSVQSPSRKFVDRGTQFGVHVDNHGNSILSVFDGRVDGVPHTKNASQGVLNFNAGESVSFGTDGTHAPQENAEGLFLEAATRLEGIQEIIGAARFLMKSPPSVRKNELVNRDAIVIVHERNDVQLLQPLSVIPPLEGKPHHVDGHLEARLPTGTTCRSYLLHCQQVSAGNPLTATIHFDQPILGVIANHISLNESDAIFARPETLYPDGGKLNVDESQAQRGCEFLLRNDLSGRDQIIIHADQKSLTVTLESSSIGIDQVRVITGPWRQEMTRSESVSQ